jgi:hypothetical protein
MIIMAKRSGNYVRTHNGIYNLDTFNMFEIKGDVLVINGGESNVEIIDKHHDLTKFITFNKDIIEVKEPNYPVRYTLVKDYEDIDTLLTNEGLVKVNQIKAILIYNEYADSYVRYKIIE